MKKLTRKSLIQYLLALSLLSILALIDTRSFAQTRQLDGGALSAIPKDELPQEIERTDEFWDLTVMPSWGTTESWFFGWNLSDNLMLYNHPEVFSFATELYALSQDEVSDSFFGGLGSSIEQADKTRGDIFLVPNERDYLKSLLEMAFFNSTLWFGGKYLEKATWANISFDTIHSNFKNGLWWDDDTFYVNQLRHPFQGAIYYSIARMNGFNMWESFVFTLVGSSIWEWFLEDNPPSANDYLMTNLGGVVLGEVLFRMAALVLDEKAVGFERFTRELLAFIINPSVGGDRLITGRMWHNTSSYKPGEVKIYRAVLSVGTSGYYGEYADPNNVNTSVNAPNFALQMNVDYYKAYYITGFINKPFDFLHLDAILETHSWPIATNSFNAEIYMDGLLWGYSFKSSGSNINILGLSMGFDFLHGPPATQIGVFKLGFAYLGSLSLHKRTRLNLMAISSGIIGGIQAMHYTAYGIAVYNKYNDKIQLGGHDGKYYYFGAGVSSKLKLELEIVNYMRLFTEINLYWLNSMVMKGGQEIAHIYRNGLSIDLNNFNQLSLQYTFYQRESFYRNEESLNRQMHGFMFLLGFKL